jgi:hypothetical protein
MREALGDSDDVMTNLMYTLMYFIAVLYLCKSVSGLYHSNAALFAYVHI